MRTNESQSRDWSPMQLDLRRCPSARRHSPYLHPGVSRILRLVRATSDVVSVINRLDAYLAAQVAFQGAPDSPTSSRDPFAYFSERLVAAWLGGTPADGAQASYDVIDGEGRTVRVRWLANWSDDWVSGYTLQCEPGIDRYALVIIDALDLVGVLCLDSGYVGEVSAQLGKRHPEQENSLYLTQGDWQTLVAERATFEPLGVSLLLRIDLHTAFNDR